MSKVNILGIKIDNITMSEAVETVAGWLAGPGKHYIVTPNLEFLLAAQKDYEFKKVLNEADLAIPDSSRLGWLLKVTAEKSLWKRLCYFPGGILPKIYPLTQFNTVTGTDLMDELVRMAAEKGYTVGLLGGYKGVAEKCAECLLKKYPKLKVSFASMGGEVDNHGDPREVLSIKYQVSGGRTDLLFVAFGQVKQEKWIKKNLPAIPAKVAMGVGGAFDYLSGLVPRAPGWMRSLGLEWLFRLAIQPWRIKRQLFLVKFVFSVFFGRGMK